MATIDETQAELIRLNNEIREIELDLGIARSRRLWRRRSMVFIGVIVTLMYVLYWIPFLPKVVLDAAVPAGILIVLLFSVAMYRLRIPGGREQEVEGQTFRESESDLELTLALRKETRKYLLASSEITTKVRRITYKEDAFADIDELRKESNRYRRVNNALQGVLIIGSLAATGAAGVAAQFAGMRWAILGVTFVVGISSGFMGYFKYKERSFYLQQTADAIEHEWEAVEVGVGRYKNAKDEETALADFVEEVHRLKSEQKKRQQNLEQPPEISKPE